MIPNIYHDTYMAAKWYPIPLLGKSSILAASAAVTNRDLPTWQRRSTTNNKRPQWRCQVPGKMPSSSTRDRSWELGMLIGELTLVTGVITMELTVVIG